MRGTTERLGGISEQNNGLLGTLESESLMLLGEDVVVGQIIPRQMSRRVWIELSDLKTSSKDSRGGLLESAALNALRACGIEQRVLIGAVAFDVDGSPNGQNSSTRLVLRIAVTLDAGDSSAVALDDSREVPRVSSYVHVEPTISTRRGSVDRVVRAHLFGEIRARVRVSF